MRVQISAIRSYQYPEVVVACGERQFLDERRDTLLNPTLIIEPRLCTVPGGALPG